ncbi:hypothetical protein JCM11251_005650 [Rhodosporidiobolus azoricus]
MGFTYLITGASRSLGLAYAAQLLRARPDARIVATARNPNKSEGLEELLKKHGSGKVFPLRMDVADEASVASAAEQLEASGFLENGSLDSLVLNAGIAVDGQTKPSQLKPQNVLETFDTNLFGAMRTTSAFLPTLRKGQGKQILGLSSVCASIEEWGGNTSTPAYSLSKVALNMYLRKLSVELQSEGFTVVMFHPG